MSSSRGFFIDKFLFVKRIGYGLIAAALMLLIFLSSAPELFTPSVAFYSYALFAGGVALVLLNKGLEIIQYLRLRRLRAYCLQCGWRGSGKEWYRYESCPECESDQVTLSSR